MRPACWTDGQVRGEAGQSRPEQARAGPKPRRLAVVGRWPSGIAGGLIVCVCLRMSAVRRAWDRQGSPVCIHTWIIDTLLQCTSVHTRRAYLSTNTKAHETDWKGRISSALAPSTRQNGFPSKQLLRYIRPIQAWSWKRLGTD